MDHYKLFINGAFVDAADGGTFQSIDPGTGAPIATVAKAGAADAEAAIDAARRAFDSGVWSGLTPRERADRIYAFADQITQQTLRMAITEAMDSGQIIGLSKYWGMLGSQMLRNYAHYAATGFPWEEEIPYAGNVFAPGRDFIRREPVGVCVGIVPWNFPLSMAFWKIGQAIAMGNTIVFKPASATPLGVMILAEAAKAAGIPDGVINVIAGPGGELGNILCTHPEVDKVAFTGSTEVGREIMRMGADTVKRVTLELGGKSANIILDDADMELAVEGALFGTFFHQGQVCESGTRVLVPAKHYDAFLDKLKARAESLRIGYQLDPASQQGPLVSAEQLATVERYVRLGMEEGCELVTGGERAEVPGLDGGFYYKPTIFAEVQNSMRIAREEIFGPVVCVIKYESEEEAVAIANDSIYGLAGGVFSRSNARAERIARQIRTGTMWINNYHAFGDFCPFGGYKQSGVGRELGHAGLAEYTQIKRVHVAAAADHQSNFTMKLLSDDPKIPFAQYITPTLVLAGHGSLAAVYREVVRLGARRALILTDAGVRRAGLVDRVQEALGDFCVGVYDDIAQDTDLSIVDAAAEMAREFGADIIVSVGGGSVIDTGKAVCVTLKNGGKANDHVALMRLTEPQVPHIVIPTTSGTGSEVTNVSVIKSGDAGRKVYIVDNYIVPNTAILDPLFTMTLPPGLTATTAMDAMTHAMEALTSTMSNPICDGHALNAIRLIRENLPKVISNGKDEQARGRMQMAATCAGWAFGIAQVGLAHSMAHTLGMLANVPHGAACGLVLPAVMRFNVDYATDKYVLAAQALGVSIGGKDPKEAALAAADAVEALMKEAGHPMLLREVGVTEDMLDLAALHAIADTPTLFNARPVADPTAVAGLYRQVF
ncbi:aldehyde dehydrogenase family protein [Desulfatitalea alkaliphila]|uniref:Aldehyde dehydrogenase family protein n=1 Tax=Desulfatitalea alkaliphila TaxID=2929485 RepID=A0AA41R3V7_9BACT|nr:aldehyde dehydrogenase family protein [Desulfatitalea alkaliphila]